MEKGKRLFSYLGSVFTFCILALAALMPGTKAEAALTVKEINYQNSTITIETNDSDQVLYFSDKNKKKWEMATDSFTGNSCTMDISWISVTKNYVLTFKGDKSEDILEVTIPKQVSNFKAKYDKKEGKVTFVNDDGRDVEYRKNNTMDWSPVTASSDFKRLCENGAKVYFRLAAKPGNGTDPGARCSKEAVCSIPKKTAAPKVTVNADATISVSSGWQVRKVEVKEGNGIQYVTGYNKIDGVDDVDDGKWYTYRAEKDIPVTEMDTGIANSTSSEPFVYLQFRKAATSSAQMSHITTVKIPKQEAAPSKEDMTCEYTSPTTFKLTIAKATTKVPYEFCVVDESDKGIESEIQSATWKTISSNVPMEVKKSEAADKSIIYFRKKAVGSVGSDDFKLATKYTEAMQIIYPGTQDGEVSVGGTDGIVEVIDGVCTEDNTAGYINFTIKTQYNAKIAKIGLSTSENPMSVESSTATVVSSVAKSTADEGYIITATIKSLNLSETLKTQLKNRTGLTNNVLPLYAYIQLATSGEQPAYITSNDDEKDGKKGCGLRIHVKPKSYIETDLLASDPQNKLDVTRIIGSSSTSAEQYKSFWFKINYGPSSLPIKSVKLGNYELKKGQDYTLEDDNKKFIVNMEALEKEQTLAPYYGKKQSLVITLGDETKNTEKLTGVSIKLIEPVSLKSTYSWAFRAGKLPTVQTTSSTSSNGTVTTKTERVNNYSAEYVKTTETVNGIGVSSVELTGAVLTTSSAVKGIDILDNAGTNNMIEFSNEELNTITTAVTSQPVVLTFKIRLSDGTVYNYEIKDGCTFTILV